jgi:hypothetical protein
MNGHPIGAAPVLPGGACLKRTKRALIDDGASRVDYRVFIPDASDGLAQRPLCRGWTGPSQRSRYSGRTSPGES